MDTSLRAAIREGGIVFSAIFRSGRIAMPGIVPGNSGGLIVRHLTRFASAMALAVCATVSAQAPYPNKPL